MSTPADDMALLNILRGAKFGPESGLILPTGTELTANEANALVNMEPEECGADCNCEPEANPKFIDVEISGPTNSLGVSAYPKLEANPLAPLRDNMPPQKPTTIGGHVEWMVLRTKSLSRWVESGEKDLMLETLGRLEGDIRAIRSLINADAEAAAESELKFVEALRDATVAARKPTKKERIWFKRGPKW